MTMLRNMRALVALFGNLACPKAHHVRIDVFAEMPVQTASFWQADEDALTDFFESSGLLLDSFECRPQVGLSSTQCCNFAANEAERKMRPVPRTMTR